MAKTIKTTHYATARGCQRHWVMHDVLHLEIVMQRVLASLPLADLQTFLSACGSERELAWLWADEKLWEDLLTQHFGGRRSIAAEAQADEEEAGDNGFANYDVEEDDEEEEEDEVEDEEEDAGEDERDEQEENEADQSRSSNIFVGDSDSVATNEGSAAMNSVLTTTAPSTQVLEMPKWLNIETACAVAREFVVSLTEWTQFQERISVVRGDIGTIQDLGGHAIDAIAFSGSMTMHNPYNAAAGAVFRRAGAALERHTTDLSLTLRAGESHVTPGFNSGARVLIHCHGPYNSHPRLFATLAKTYRNVLRKAKHENVACLAMTSISTGNFGVPVPEAARTGMQAILGFLRAHHEWQGRVGVVCYEEHVFTAFRDERQRVLDGFNVTTTL